MKKYINGMHFRYNLMSILMGVISLQWGQVFAAAIQAIP